MCCLAGKITVTLNSKASYGDFTVRKFSIQEEKVCLRERELVYISYVVCFDMKLVRMEPLCSSSTQGYHLMSCSGMCGSVCVVH